MTEEVIWKDPPPDNKGKTVWEDRLTPLMAHPSRWALVATTKSNSTAAQLRKRTYRYPEGNWEFRSHATPQGSEVYARYLGPTEEGES